MFINFWYAAADSQAVTDKPLHVRMLGHDFVLFRDPDGGAHCLSNICTHRGASLAHGKVKGAAIECPYHGWQFRGSDGICTRIPSLGKDAKIPARAKVDSYPVQEKYGLVFAFLGDLPADERPPLIDFKEYGDPKWRVTANTYEVDCNFQRTLENTLDPAHTEFVHPAMGFQGEKDDYMIEDFELVETPWGCGNKSRAVDTPMAAGSIKREVRGEGAKTETETGHFGPNATYTYIHFSPVASSHQYSFITPIDAYRTRRFFRQARNFAMAPEADERMNARVWDVINQDRVVVERIEPRLTPLSPTEEVIVPSDRVITRFREYARTWEARGWKIDTDALRAAPETKAFAIPSPARGTTKGWALEPTPLVSADPAALAAE